MIESREGIAGGGAGSGASEHRTLERLTWAAAALSALASLLHGVVTPEHFDEWWGYGFFFVVAAVAQMVFAVMLVLGPWAATAGGELARRRPPVSARTVYLLGIIGNVAIVALYVVTRTIGIPFFGPEAGEVEEIGGIDAVSKVTELVLIGVLLVMYRLAGRLRPAVG